MTKFIQRQHALRLLIATPVAVFFFYWFPMTFSTPKPECFGLWKSLFDALMGFDKPFNQSPSLHIILLVILWRIYLPHLGRISKLLWNFWCFLIGISVLTTFQHHFIDIPAGFLAGVVICYLFPLSKMNYWKWQKVKSIPLTVIHLSIAILSFILAFTLPVYIAIIIIWIGFSLFFIGLGYLGLGAVIFQKKKMDLLLLLPKFCFSLIVVALVLLDIYFSNHMIPHKKLLQICI